MLLSFLSALVLAPSSASASVRTQWDTSPACVDADSLPTRVDGLLAEPPSSPVRLSLGALAHDDAWQISMRVDGLPQPLTRTLRGHDCATLTEAVALVVAVQLDAMAVADAIPLRAEVDALEPERVPEPTPEPPATTSPPPATAPRPAVLEGPASETPRRPQPRPRVQLGAALAGELGILPRGGASLELSAGAAWPRARLLASGLASVGPGEVTQALPSVGGRFALLAGVARACGVVGRSRFELPLCGALELGDLRGRGTGLERPRTVNTAWVAVAAGARPQWRLGRHAYLGGLVDLVVPLVRQRFGIPEAGLVHLVPAVGARVGVRVQWRLP
ncbi:MAG: hypothetical protein H6712_13155 [Myxococcales bacterium]|nr:hypothetical protein [Myxococcales bacterium]